MKMILKVIAAPFVLVLTLLTALCRFLFDLCAFILTIASVIVVILRIGIFFTPTPLGGFVFLFLTFLLSPYGLQAVTGFLIGVLDGGKSALCWFIASWYNLGVHWPEDIRGADFSLDLGEVVSPFLPGYKNIARSLVWLVSLRIDWQSIVNFYNVPFIHRCKHSKL